MISNAEIAAVLGVGNSLKPPSLSVGVLTPRNTRDSKSGSNSATMKSSLKETRTVSLVEI